MDLIVVIEDEEDILDLLEYHLQKAGYDTEGFLSTKGVEDLLYEEQVDLLLVDRNLPYVDGADFVSNLRKSEINTPVIFLTAKDQDQDILDGFEKGADDYITKPFNIDELLARVKAILGRSKHTNKSSIEHRDIKLYKNSNEATIGGTPIDLTNLEFQLLYEFVSNKNIILSREELLESVWKKSADSNNLKTVNVAIKRLKEKIDPNGEKNYIKAIRGTGYIVN